MVTGSIESLCSNLLLTLVYQLQGNKIRFQYSFTAKNKLEWREFYVGVLSTLYTCAALFFWRGALSADE